MGAITFTARKQTPCALYCHYRRRLGTCASLFDWMPLASQLARDGFIPAGNDPALSIGVHRRRLCIMIEAYCLSISFFLASFHGVLASLVGKCMMVINTIGDGGIFVNVRGSQHPSDISILIDHETLHLCASNTKGQFSGPIFERKRF